MADLIILAQATTPPKPLSPVIPSAPVMPKAPTASTLPSSPTGTTTTQLRQIEASDLLDKAGLGQWADTITMSVVAVICAAVLTGVFLAIFRKAFGSGEDMKVKLDAQEKLYFELTSRKRKAEMKIEGLKRYVAALEAELGKA